MSDVARSPKIGVKAAIVKDNHLLTIVKQYSDGIAYILPGGGQEQGETLDAAIRRECREEIGVDVTVEYLLFVREYIGANHEHAATDNELHIVDLIFACHVPDNYVPHLGSLPDAEQVGVTWLPLDTLDQYPFYPVALKAWLLRSESTSVYVGDIN